MLAQQFSLGDAGFGQVAPYQQIAPYSCGAAVLKAVMQHWGDYADEPTLIDEIGIDPKAGSTVQQVANTAERYGYSTHARFFDSIDELKPFTSQDIPVIIAIQSFKRPNQGHFVVATDVTPCCVDIMDPNVEGNRRTLSRAELDRRWRFRNRVGLVVLPRRKRKTFGEGKHEPRHVFALVTVSAFVVLAAATAGVAIYRRHKRS